MSAYSTADTSLDSYIIGMSFKLRNMSQDILQFAKYDGADLSSTESRYGKYLRNAINFTVGAHLCEKYLYGSIGLDEFCAEMIDEDLKEFLIEIPHLPEELVSKYELVFTTEDGDGGNGDKVEDTSKAEKDICKL